MHVLASGRMRSVLGGRGRVSVTHTALSLAGLREGALAESKASAESPVRASQ